MKLIRVITIQSDLRLIEEKTIKGLEDAQKIVGGFIALAHRLPNGDELFVNEKPKAKHAFTFDNFYEGFDGQPLVGNAYVIGRNSTNAKSSLTQIKRLTKFWEEKLKKLTKRQLVDFAKRELKTAAFVDGRWYIRQTSDGIIYFDPRRVGARADVVINKSEGKLRAVYPKDNR